MFLSSCSNIQDNLMNAQKEATEAAQNLANDALEKKELIEEKVTQVKTASESISDAIDSVNQATSDIKAASSNIKAVRSDQSDKEN